MFVKYLLNLIPFIKSTEKPSQKRAFNAAGKIVKKLTSIGILLAYTYEINIFFMRKIGSMRTYYVYAIR